MLGLAETGLGTQLDDWLARIHPEDVESFRTKIADHRAARTKHFEAEHRLRHQSGEFRWMLARGLAVYDTSGQATRMAGSLTDITDRKHAEDQFRHDALHDRLTGLPNRALFEDRLAHALQRLKRSPEYRFAVMFLDLDGFKAVNDQRGHQAGDKLLVEVAGRLSSIVRPVDTVGRQGGDEFTMLLDGVKDLENAVVIAERVLKDFAAPFVLDGGPIMVSTSIGIAMSSATYETAAEILRDADLAMYRAKAFGKARFEVFSPGLPERVDTPVRLGQ
jgi:diguanylate cyclase (GGDEF)-like protein